MRKYRGERIDNGEEVYGYYAVVEKRHFIFTSKTILSISCYQFNSPKGYPKLEGSYEVIPETVGQSTGKLDKNKKEIYQGHIVKWAYDELVDSGSRTIHHEGEGEVFWSKELLHFGIREEGIIGHQEFWEDATYEIIGTVHDKEK